MSRSPFYIIVMREPISRVVSLFDYIFRHLFIAPMREYYKLWGNKTLSEVIVESNEMLYTLPNVQFNQVPLYNIALQQLFFLCGFNCLLEKESIPIREDWLRSSMNAALRNIEESMVVGTTESMDDLIPQLKFHTVDLVPPYVTQFTTLNARKSIETKSVLSNQAHDILKEWLAPEIVLYQAVKIKSKELTRVAKECLNGAT